MLVVTSAHAREGYSSHFVMLSSFCLSLFRPVILSFCRSVVQHGISTTANFYIA